MAFLTASLTIDIPADPNQAATEAICGVYGYQPLIPGISGLIPNPQSSGNFANATLSGFLNGIIMKWYKGVATQSAQIAAISGVNYLLGSGTPFLYL